MKEYVYLNDMLTLLTERSGIHVSIHDVSGILHRPDLRIDYKFVIHSKRFCKAAKYTREGYDTCRRCKRICTRKAVRDGKYFYGHCPFGLFEVVYPVIVESKVAAVIYVGNAVTDLDESRRRAMRTGDTRLVKAIDSCAFVSPDELVRVARAVDSYIGFILSTEPPEESASVRYPISEIKARIHSEYKKPLSLRDMSELYFFNEKYLGRLFASETGMTFHEYLNKIRLEKAADMLEASSFPVIDISLECGFGSVSYFNRVFKKTFGRTPLEYRKGFRN